MEKKIKVYLQYPWKTSDSQYYKSLIENPPKNVEYISESKRVKIITNRNYFKIRVFLKNFLRNFLRLTGISIINIHKTRINKKYDLIHCAHCLSKNKNKPWIADFEGIWQMWIMGNQSKKTKEKISKILLKDNCKKIVTWTETAKKELIEKFPEIGKKISIVSYAMPAPKIKKRKTNKITLLFVARYFYEKGGLHVLEIFDRLTKKYENVKAIFVSLIPKRISKKYEKNKKIKILGLIPYEKLKKEIFPISDLFVYPGYSDSFGFSFIEALAFGMPIITVDGFARKDIINEEKTGYIISKPAVFSQEKIGKNENELIQKMVDKTSLLIENKKLREKMSRECIKKVKTGKFSIIERNKRLKKIYEGALR